MSTTTILYHLAFFEGFGFYAARQPNYTWSFTDDVDKAFWYKTHKKAKERVDWADELATQHRKTGNIRTIEVVTHTQITELL